MDLCDTVPARERHANAMKLLTMVEMEEHAKKLPSALSGGQQQRVAIARALANNPPILIADEPTGNLDSKTAESIFSLFKSLSLAGKTVVMVTHDSTLAQRVARTIIIADGEIVNEYVAKAFPTLSPSLMLEVSRNLTKKTYAAGETINQQSLGDDLFYIIAEGKAEISLRRPNGNDIVVDRLGLGQYFGEISLLTNQRTMATIRANPNTPLTVLTVKKTMFQKLLDDSSDFKSMIQNIANKRWRENREIIEGKEISDVIII
jgi:ABC-type multidrug transport system ATPase subunit